MNWRTKTQLSKWNEGVLLCRGVARGASRGRTAGALTAGGVKGWGRLDGCAGRRVGGGAALGAAVGHLAALRVRPLTGGGVSQDLRGAPRRQRAPPLPLSP